MSTKKPRIVCLCGSTRFYDAFQEANLTETLAGNIVLSVGFYSHSSERAHGRFLECGAEQHAQLNELHKRKIAMSHEVLILNVGGYVGEGLRDEIEYAKSLGKPIRWLEEQHDVS